jgi:hypothetical protein
VQEYEARLTRFRTQLLRIRKKTFDEAVHAASPLRDGSPAAQALVAELQKKAHRVALMIESNEKIPLELAAPTLATTEHPPERRGFCAYISNFLRKWFR